MYCNIAFKCYQGGYAEFHDLCDRTESCPGENKICEVARNQPTVHTTVPGDEIKITLGKLLPGLSNFNRIYVDKIFRTKPENLFGVQNLTIRGVPDTDCRYTYGEQYVFLSCSDMCKHASCPLKEVLHDTCINVPLKHRIYTYSLDKDNSKLTVVRRKKGKYFGDIFSCDNRRCISYEKVRVLLKTL